MIADPSRSLADVPRVRTAAHADCGYLAALHAATLPHGFFVELGPRFLRRYHRTFVESPHARAYVAVVGDRPAGGLVGTLDNRAHWRWVVRRQGARLAVAGALALASRPRVSARFVRTRAVRYAGAAARLLRAHPASARVLRARRAPERLAGVRRKAEPEVAPGPTHRVAVLTHVCVGPADQGRGAGGALVDAFLDEARAAGAREATLVTLAGEAGAGRFYARRGWTYAGERRDRDGRPLSIYSRTLP